jgi:aspartate kinase
MSARIVCKFGGSSLADGNQCRKARAIVEGDPRRSVIVPSAPGKRNSSDAKLTDLLYLCQSSAALGTDYGAAFARVRERFVDIERDLGLTGVVGPELERFHAELGAGASRDYAASRGEYLNGRLLAAWLDADFVDPADYVVLNVDGRIDPVTYRLLGERLADASRRYVMPGFYGRDHKGQIKTFSRGGSDVSGAIAARAAGAECYENWTDVSGLLVTDPRIIPEARPIVEVTYAEIRELSYMGASVLHDEAISPVREAGIPIWIRNTNAPEEPGTRIVAHSSGKQARRIAGIAGKRAFAMICIEKNLMNKEVGFAYRLLGVLEHHGISFEHCPSSIDSMSVIIESAQLEDKTELVLDEIRNTLQPDRVEFVPAIALIAIVGEGMARTIGVSATVFTALRDAGVNVRVINQGASELNIIVGVAPEDYERAVRAIYDAFVAAPVEEAI